MKFFHLFGILFAFGPLLLIQGAPEISRTGEYVLTAFGETSTAAAAQKTLDAACQWIIANGGGLLVIPASVTAPFEAQNTYQKDRESGPTVTIVDRRKGYETRQLPTVGKISPTGWYGAYDYRLINMDGHGLPFQGNHEMRGMRNAVVRGASSYMQLAGAAVAKGKDRRIYVPTIRGIFVGQYLNLTGQRFSYAQPYDQFWVKSIGWDAEKKLNYLVADLEHDHPEGAILYNKHVTGSLTIDSTANCDNQTMELQVTRHQYAHGDSFLISGGYVYQGDVFSGLGDERGVVLNAEVMHDADPFHSKVEAVDWRRDALVFAPGACNVHKLAASRAIINMNSNKWFASGAVAIVPPEDWGGHIIHNPKYDVKTFIRDGIDLKPFALTYQKEGQPAPSITTWDGHRLKKFNYIYKGKAYPSLHDGGINYLGGCIEGSADCGWTPEVVGRFFAVADEGERLAPTDKVTGADYHGALLRPIYRWYLIKQFKKNADGTCRIKIERIRWAAVDAGAPNLYNADNYTWDGHARPLKYIIAPGAYAYDVGDAWQDTNSGVAPPSSPRIIRVVPNGDRGTKFDFAAGDAIEQAIGADPAIPVPIRVRMFNNVPDTLEHSALELTNYGRVQTNTGIGLGGGGHNRDDLARRKDGKPFFGTGLNIGCVVGAGVRFGADVTEAAIAFEQPNQREQPIKWRHENGETSLTVDPKTGDLTIRGSDLAVPTVKGARGLSATATAANNLRGINVAVPKDARELTIKFEQPEPDNQYSLNVQPNWMTPDAVVEKTVSGFKVAFGTPAGNGAKIDWQLIR
ncbi:MAG: hypothetical protein HY360_12965 [Verrucomicrobia bacterium]|nr:hypothetical protein [Verrucomicrobiota bacterium]